jgi:hypothetical protein
MPRFSLMILLSSFLLAACSAVPSLDYPMIVVNFELQERARELIENPQTVLAPMLELRLLERVVLFQGFRANKVDVYDRIEVDIDLQQLCLPDGRIGEAQDYVLDNMRIILSGELIPELGSSMLIENPIGNDYRVQPCDSQENLVLTVTAFVKFAAGVHLGELELTLRDASLVTYDFGFETSSGVRFGG